MDKSSYITKPVFPRLAQRGSDSLCEETERTFVYEINEKAAQRISKYRDHQLTPLCGQSTAQDFISAGVSATAADGNVHRLHNAVTIS